MYPAYGEIVVTNTDKPKLKKEKTIKVRMDAIDIYELDEICRKLGFAERATTIRHLIHHYTDIEEGKQIVLSYRDLMEKLTKFQNLLR